MIENMFNDMFKGENYPFKKNNNKNEGNNGNGIIDRVKNWFVEKYNNLTEWWKNKQKEREEKRKISESLGINNFAPLYVRFALYDIEQQGPEGENFLKKIDNKKQDFEKKMNEEITKISKENVKEYIFIENKNGIRKYQNKANETDTIVCDKKNNFNPKMGNNAVYIFTEKNKEDDEIKDEQVFITDENGEYSKIYTYSSLMEKNFDRSKDNNITSRKANSDYGLNRLSFEYKTEEQKNVYFSFNWLNGKKKPNSAKFLDGEFSDMFCSGSPYLEIECDDSTYYLFKEKILYVNKNPSVFDKIKNLTTDNKIVEEIDDTKTKNEVKTKLRKAFLTLRNADEDFLKKNLKEARLPEEIGTLMDEWLSEEKESCSCCKSFEDETKEIKNETNVNLGDANKEKEEIMEIIKKCVISKDNMNYSSHNIFDENQ